MKVGNRYWQSNALGISYVGIQKQNLSESKDAAL